MIDRAGAVAPTLPALSAGRQHEDDPDRVRDAAQQFEALLLAQMLQSVRENESEGWLGTGQDSAASSAMAIAEEQFAHLMAAGGGLGLTKLIVAGLGEKK
jgi:Rod binding domain-containing protein